MEDAEVAKVINALEKPGHPDTCVLLNRGYCLDNGVLYRRSEEEDDDRALMVVPDSEK